MAKLKAPLFSFEARGALAKTVVHFPWKGLNVVREYVTPANPRSPAQMAQRSKFTEAVDSVHFAQMQADQLMDNDDVSAYALLASLQKTPRTWFNTIVKLYVECLLAAKVPLIWNFAALDVSTPKQINIEARCCIGIPLDVRVHWGTSKSALLSQKALTIGSAFTEWQAETPYVLDQNVTPTAANYTGYRYICIAAGTSGATEPTWPTRIDETVVDATVTWICERCPDCLWQNLLTDLSSGLTYFLQFRPAAGDICLGGNSGIYRIIVT